MNPLDPALSLGRTIQLYLVDGTPNGLILATLKGWTGSVLLARTVRCLISYGGPRPLALVFTSFMDLIRTMI